MEFVNYYLLSVCIYTNLFYLEPVVAAKSSITLDVKPWDDEVDMEELTSLVKGIKVDGLLWGASKLVPIAFGIKKLQICCVVEDDKVSLYYESLRLLCVGNLLHYYFIQH